MGRKFEDLKFKSGSPRIGPDAATAAAASAGVENRRWAHRRPQLAPAIIISDRMHVTQLCIVRDMSSTGAKLEIQYEKSAISRSVPDTFKLVLKADHAEVDCEVAWRQHNLVGVRFLSSLRKPVAVAKPKAKAKGLTPAKE